MVFMLVNNTKVPPNLNGRILTEVFTRLMSQRRTSIDRVGSHYRKEVGSPSKMQTSIPPDLQFFSLLRGHKLQRGHYQPATLIVLDVCTNFACYFGVTVAIQVVILEAGVRHISIANSSLSPSILLTVTAKMHNYLYLEEFTHLQ